eukprot:scaffold1314_cov158-Amphora_coffeaeformis.AAC.3
MSTAAKGAPDHDIARNVDEQAAPATVDASTAAAENYNSPWQTYQEALLDWERRKQATNPGHFAQLMEDRFYQCCRVFPLSDPVLRSMPMLNLNLRVYLVKSPTWRTLNGTNHLSRRTKQQGLCLAKTLAHELGHAVGLKHTRGQFFRCDTIAPYNLSGRPNLMEGGADRHGGGGTFLEDWGILQARHVAEQTLLTREHD